MKFYTIVAKGLKLKVRKFWGTIPTFAEVTEQNWPRQLDIKPSVESDKEVKISKEHKSIVITTVEIKDDFDLIMHKFDLHKT